MKKLLSLGIFWLSVVCLNAQTSEWTFHMDLWQNPYVVSHYYNVKPFSKEHFDLMRPLIKLYADAGEKVNAASIIHKPWDGQTYDAFESMVPWRLSFQYFDQVSNSFRFLEAKPGETVYKEFQTNILQDFARYLKAKG